MAEVIEVEIELASQQDIKPKMGQISIRKKMIFMRNLEDF